MKQPSDLLIAVGVLAAIFSVLDIGIRLGKRLLRRYIPPLDPTRPPLDPKKVPKDCRWHPLAERCLVHAEGDCPD